MGRVRIPSPAMCVALLALFVALGGSSYAALKVTGRNVQNSSLTGSDVRNNSLTGRDVKGLGSGDIANGSLLAGDFKPGQLPAGPSGPSGPRGPAGPTAGVINGENPPSNPAVYSEFARSISTPAAGRLFVFASGVLTSSCSGGSPELGLYLDGSPVPGSLHTVANGVSYSVQLLGITSASVPAGSHQVQVRLVCPGASVSAPGDEPMVGAIVLGG